MGDLIDRQAAIDALVNESQSDGAYGYIDTKSIICMLNDLPSAQPDVPERNVGKWTEMTVIHKDEAKDIIEEWQSCRCSVCGRYHTQPYMYYFYEPKFCSWCGAEMRKETEDGRSNTVED